MFQAHIVKCGGPGGRTHSPKPERTAAPTTITATTEPRTSSPTPTSLSAPFTPGFSPLLGAAGAVMVTFTSTTAALGETVRVFPPAACAGTTPGVGTRANVKTVLVREEASGVCETTRVETTRTGGREEMLA